MTLRLLFAGAVLCLLGCAGTPTEPVGRAPAVTCTVVQTPAGIQDGCQ